jgi:hypothetical protein
VVLLLLPRGFLLLRRLVLYGEGQEAAWLWQRMKMTQERLGKLFESEQLLQLVYKHLVLQVVLALHWLSPLCQS